MTRLRISAIICSFTIFLAFIYDGIRKLFSVRRSPVFAVLAILIFLSTIGFLKPTSAASEPEQKPYKAKTVDECIDEKECVWIAFARMTGLLDWKNRPIEGKILHKWEELFTYSIEGENEYSGKLLEVINQLKIFFPYEIKSDQAANHLMIFSRDIEESYAKVEPTIFFNLDRYSTDMFLENKGPPPCQALTLSNHTTGALRKIFSLVDIKHEYAGYCVAIAFYNGLGFSGKTYAEVGVHGKKRVHPFSIFSGRSKNFKFTELDKFILYMFYQPEFRSGQNIADVRIVFDRVYQSSRKKFLVL